MQQYSQSGTGPTQPRPMGFNSAVPRHPEPGYPEAQQVSRQPGYTPYAPYRSPTGEPFPKGSVSFRPEHFEALGQYLQYLQYQRQADQQYMQQFQQHQNFDPRAMGPGGYS